MGLKGAAASLEISRWPRIGGGRLTFAQGRSRSFRLIRLGVDGGFDWNRRDVVRSAGGRAAARPADNGFTWTVYPASMSGRGSESKGRERPKTRRLLGKLNSPQSRRAAGYQSRRANQFAAYCRGGRWAIYSVRCLLICFRPRGWGFGLRALLSIVGGPGCSAEELLVDLPEAASGLMKLAVTCPGVMLYSSCRAQIGGGQESRTMKTARAARNRERSAVVGALHGFDRCH